MVIADDIPEVRAALVELISSAAGLELAGVAGDADEAVDLCRRVQPDVALVDVRMPKGGGPAAAAGMRRVCPRTAVLALSAFDDAALRADMAAAGARRYLTKGGDVKAVLNAIMEVAAAPRQP